MSSRSTRRTRTSTVGVNTETHETLASPSPSPSSTDDVSSSDILLLPSSSPLRRTRSQTGSLPSQRKSQQQNGTSESNGHSHDEDHDSHDHHDHSSPHSPSPSPPCTPTRRRLLKSTASRLSHSTISPLMERTSAAFTSVKASCSRYQLLAYEHVPEWLRDNRYIKSGYRANIGWKQSVESVCHLHNETINVWTHIIGFLIMTFLLIGTMMVLSPHGADRLDLDVVLSARPLAPACDTTRMEADGITPVLCEASITNTSPSATTAEDPLELLHQLLGDQQDEMLVELLSRVQTHVPSLEYLTSILKEKSSSIQSSLRSIVPDINLGVELKDVTESVTSTQMSFIEYIIHIESKIHSLKSTLGEALEQASKTYHIPGGQQMLDVENAAEETAAKAKIWATEEWKKLKQSLRELSQDFSPDLLLQFTRSSYSSTRDLDIIKLTQQFFNRFLDQSHFRSGFSLSPTLQAMPGVKVKLKSGNALGAGTENTAKEIGTGNVVGLGVADVLHDLSAITTDVSSSSASSSSDKSSSSPSVSHIDPSYITSTLDADGQGRTVSTAIGYMGIEAHTSFSRPGSVELQLHSYLPRYPLAIFIVTAMMCLLFSSIYHLMHAVSDVWARRFQALDYAGIVLLIAGSTHPIIYFAFYCSPILKWIYISVVWFLALVVFTIVVLPSYRAPKFRSLKVACFVALGFSGCIPLAHFNTILGEVHFILYWLLAMGFCYLSGAAIYLFQVPERWYPGMFDYFFSSHQLWHTSIFAAVMVHYFGLIQMYEWRMTRVCGGGIMA